MYPVAHNGILWRNVFAYCDQATAMLKFCFITYTLIYRHDWQGTADKIAFCDSRLPGEMYNAVEVPTRLVNISLFRNSKFH